MEAAHAAARRKVTLWWQLFNDHFAVDPDPATDRRGVDRAGTPDWGPSPALFALAGTGVAFLPHGPRLALEPDLVLALFVAPVLLDAAFDSSVRDLRENSIPLTSLVFVAVGVTTAAVAMVARWLDPAMPWAVGIVLGALVLAPPTRRRRLPRWRKSTLPHRLLVILEGRACSTTPVRS